uniref:Maturin n=1 Tax=Ficedula albicollis TaxID=59894 RepID=A0A803V324_FICAL
MLIKSRFLLRNVAHERACNACPQGGSELQEAQCTLADVYNMSPYKITWKGWHEFLLMPFLSCVAVGFQHVWSESEDCLPFLQLAQDYISSCGKKTLHEILEKVFKSFRPLLGLPDVDDDAFEEYNADVEEEEPEADHQQMGVSQQ